MGLTLVWVAVIVLTVVLVILLGAMVEMYRSLERVRIETGIMDSRVMINLAMDPDASVVSMGLPEEISEVNRAIVLLLSDSCGTCHQIASQLTRGLPESVWLLLQPRSRGSGEKWLANYALKEDPRVFIDPEGALSTRMGIDISPAVIRVRAGRVVAAHTLPSPRRLEEEVRWVASSGGPDRPSYGSLEGLAVSVGSRAGKGVM